MVTENPDYGSFFLQDVVLNSNEPDICILEDQMPGGDFANYSNTSDAYIQGFMEFLHSIYDENSCDAIGVVEFEHDKFDLEKYDSNQGDSLLGSVVKQHEDNTQKRLWILDHVVQGMSLVYYGFVIYTSPISALSLGTFKVLKSYGAFDSVCNDENTILGYTACDVFEEALFSQVLFSVGGELAAALGSAELGVKSKFLLDASEKIIRKTALSNGKIKSRDLVVPSSVDCISNTAHVVVSEVVEATTESFLPKPLHKAAYKVSAQLSKQFVKDSIREEDPETGKDVSKENDSKYIESIKKGLVVTLCNIALPDFKEKLKSAHLYGHCMSFFGYLGTKAMIVDEPKKSHT